MESLTVQEGADRQIIRAAKPTGSDARQCREPELVNNQTKDEQLAEPTPPEENATLQTKNESAKYSSNDKSGSGANNQQGDKTFKNPAVKANYKVLGNRDPSSQHDHRSLTGVDDGAIPGSRVGYPLMMQAENQLGDKVFDIDSDGSHWLKVQTKDKKRAFAVDGSDAIENDADIVNKMKVEIRFPSINREVCQRRLLIMQTQLINNDDDQDNGSEAIETAPCEMFFPPDVSHIQVLLPLDTGVHIELTHIDKDGYATLPYVCDFITNNRVTPRPFEASPIGFELMETVVVHQDKEQAQSMTQTSKSDVKPVMTVKTEVPKSTSSPTTPTQGQTKKEEPKKEEPKK